MRVENGKKVFSVREVNSYIGNIIKNDYLLKNICFEGEVSSFSKGPTGHLYITLKDCTARSARGRAVQRNPACECVEKCRGKAQSDDGQAGRYPDCEGKLLYL